MQFVAHNVAKEVELDSTSATIARNVTRKVAQCVRALSVTESHFKMTLHYVNPFTLAWCYVAVE